MSTIAQLNERIDQLETQLLLKDIETIKQAEKKLNSDLGNFSKVICVSIRYKIDSPTSRYKVTPECLFQATILYIFATR